MYTLKFNSPILPFAKFPLTQNKYIQDFLKRYEEDKDNIEKIIGVHFKENSNLNAENAVGIEIEIRKANGVTYVESHSDRRYKVLRFDEVSNFSMAEQVVEAEKVDPNSAVNRNDLLQSEVFELKNLWFTQ